jgi:geranylgeranyl diphosphate synthase, type II
VIHQIATCAGSYGMVGGQVVDMESEGKPDMDLPTVQYIHTHKTGALIKASWWPARCWAALMKRATGCY